MVRVNTQSLIIQNLNGGEFPLLENVMGIRKAGAVRSWQVQIPGRKSDVVAGRICIIRKTEEAIKIAQAKLRRNAQKKGHSLKPETLEYAKYVIVFTTFPEESFNDIDVLEWYRIRWQVELIFKRFKSIAQLGHLPKHSDDSSKAWLYGKLFVALLTEKLIKHASSVSPGDISWKNNQPQSVWREFNFCVQSGETCYRTAPRSRRHDYRLEGYF